MKQLGDEHMIGPDGDANVDPWTAMPIELDDVEVQPLRVVGAPALKKSSKFDIHGLFWRYMASGSAATPQEVLACLATDERVQIRRRVAENSSTPAAALALLASDEVAAVRASVARNPRTPVYILKQLAQDEDEDVRFEIASNKDMPDAILLSLFMDPSALVAERASQTLAA